MIQHQPLNISIRQFTENPSGKGSAFLAKRAMIKQGLNATYVKLLNHYRRAFYAVPYVLDDGRYLYHVKVPSEMYNINRISYDVLIEFAADSTGKRLAMRNAKFFSNSPSFIFTYAYVFNAKQILIDDFKSALPNQCLTQAPVIRNPIESMGYEKSLYVACRYLQDSYALSEKYIVKFGKKYNSLIAMDLKRRIADPETLIAVYQHAQYMHRKTHRIKLTPSEIKKREDRAKRFSEAQKRNRPQGRIGLFGIHIAPRPALTARKAAKLIKQENNKKSTIKAKKQISIHRK